MERTLKESQANPATTSIITQEISIIVAIFIFFTPFVTSTSVNLRQCLDDIIEGLVFQLRDRLRRYKVYNKDV